MNKLYIISILLITLACAVCHSLLSADDQKHTLYLPPPQNLSAVGGNECINLEWDLPDTVQKIEQETNLPVTNRNHIVIQCSIDNSLNHLGYNIYEQDKGFVSYIEGSDNTEFTDDIVAVGAEYTYWVTAVYQEGESCPSNTDTAIPYISLGFYETFYFDWATTGWREEPSNGNWMWSPDYAYLNWSPTIEDYDMSLISPQFSLPNNPQWIWDLVVSMYINDYSTDTGEVMEIWVIHDTGEDMIFEWNLDYNDDWGASGGSDWTYENMHQYAGQTIQLKFRSHGGSTYHFNSWYIYSILQPISWLAYYGAIEGMVTDSDGTPLEMVRVTADETRYNPVWTDENGYYLYNPVYKGMYNMEFFLDGYNTEWVFNVEVIEFDTTVVNVVLPDYVSANHTPFEETDLHPNFPNPVLNNTTFEFSLKEPSHVTLSVYNLKGQLVATLLDDEFEPTASHCIEWDGTADGKKLANGIYFYKLETGTKSFLKKMVLMR